MADEIGAFTPEQARLIWQDYQTRQQLVPQISQNFPQRRIIDEPSPHRVWVRNDSSEAIPAYGCMQITGTAEVSGRTVVKVTKPTDTDGEYLTNSQFAIPVIGEGESGCGWAYRFGVVVFLGDPPTDPARYRPIVDSWEVEEGDGPFVIFGAHNAAEGSLIGRIDSHHAIIIQTPSGGIPARSGTTVGKADCEIYSIDGDDDLVATGVSVSVVNLAAEAVAGSVYGQAKRAGGRWVIDYEECE
jgi:hypothetical protein